jgi:hypothetical protein
LNFAPAMVERSLDLLAIHAWSNLESVIWSVFECHPERSRNFLQVAEQPLAFSLDTAETKCLCELLVLHTTKRKHVENSTRTFLVLP